jgi:hypothetical protein
MYDSDVTSRLERAIAVSLGAFEAIAGSLAREQFQRAVDDVAGYGEAVAAQHLRNKLLAFAGKRDRTHPHSTTWPRIAKIVKQLDGALGAYFEPRLLPWRGGGERRRVLLLLDHLPPAGREWSQTRWICTYAAALARNPDVEAVRLLATQETAPEGPVGVSTELTWDHVMGWRDELEQIAGGPAPNVDLVTTDRLGPVRPYEDALRLATDFRPDIVLAYLGMFQSRLLPALLRPHAAICAVQLNRNHREPPYADLVLAHSLVTDFSDKPTPDKWRAHAIPLAPFPKQQTLDPLRLGPVSPMRVVTVLSRGRLEKSLMADDAAGLTLVVTFLEEFLDAVWLLVAIEDPAAFGARIAPLVPAAVAGRLRLLPVMPDLRAVYEHCHLYMHLPGMEGGGMGMAMAVAEGLPVIAAKGTDAANFLPPDHAYPQALSAAKMLRRWASSSEVRRRKARKQKMVLDNVHSLDAAGAAFSPLLAQVVDRCGRRASEVGAPPCPPDRT